MEKKKKRTLLYVKSSSVFNQYDIIYIYIINSINGILILKKTIRHHSHVFSVFNKAVSVSSWVCAIYYSNVTTN